MSHDNYSLSARVYNHIRDGILAGTFAKGDELKEKNIGDESGLFFVIFAGTNINLCIMAEKKESYSEEELNEKHGYKCKERTEFLSRLKRTDKFHPIITIVFYYGEKCWDGPVNLKDMMVDMPGKIAEKFNDYRLNLIQIRDSYKYRFYNDDVRLLFDFVSDLYNKEFDKIFKEYKGRDVSIEFIEMIGRITGTKELVKLADNGRKDKVVNMEMCNAMKEFLEGGRREGQREGRIEGQREGRIEGKDEARLDSIRTLMKKLDQTAEEAMDTLDIADEDKVRYRKMLGL